MRTSEIADEERLARAAWSRLAEPGDAKARAVIDRHGYVAALEVVQAQLAPEADRFAARLERLDVDRDLEIAGKCGARLVVPGDDAWPAGLDDLEFPPHCLWVRGHLGTLRRSVAVVGARAATGYGVYHAREIAAGVAERGWVVVSGGAFGIDAAAHEGALAVGGRTVCVLAGGVERPYPAAHRELIDAIAERGAVISEVPPGSAPTRHRFLLRNRLIATMTTGTIVVEAAARSGSLNTARTAGAHGRPVGAVPGTVDSEMSRGCHEAVREGLATLVTDAADVIDLLGDVGTDLAPDRTSPDTSRDGLDEAEARVLGILPARAQRSVDDLAAAAGLAVREVTLALVSLELAGWALRTGNGWCRAPKRSA